MPVAASGPLGAETCGTCHIQEYEQWKKTPHALALARLSATQQRNRGCRGCHTTAPQSDNPSLSGVQCEACHGSGQFYAPANVMKDKKLASLMGLKSVTKSTCLTCHTKDGSGLSDFKYEEKLPLVLHRPQVQAKKSDKK